MNTKLMMSAVVAFGTIALVTGCGKDSEVAKNVEREVRTAQIDDQWSAGCQKSDIFGLTSEVVEFDKGASFSKTTTLYSSDNCGTPEVRVVENGSADLGREVSDNTFEFNQSFDSVAITPVNEAGQKALNLVAACGFTDWQVGIEKNVTAESSNSPVLARCWTKTPRKVYDVVQVDGDQLRFGLEEDGKDKSAPAKRPTNIDQTITYSRK